MVSKYTMEVRPINANIGAEVRNIDLSEALSAAQFDTLYRAFLNHHVLLFRNQRLTPDRYLAIAGRFGAIGDYPFAAGMKDYPAIVEIIKEPHQTSNFGGIWHTDTCYLPRPPKATLLYARQTPPVGGDTLFACFHSAYNALSSGLQRSIADLHVVNTATKTATAVRGDHLLTGSMAAIDQSAEALSAIHPLVRSHPETGQPGLYFSPAHSEKFSEMSVAESEPLLRYLQAQAIRPEWSCRIQWQPDSLLIWDNRSTLHCAVNDYDGYRRVMQRITVNA